MNWTDGVADTGRYLIGFNDLDHGRNCCEADPRTMRYPSWRYARIYIALLCCVFILLIIRSHYIDRLFLENYYVSHIYETDRSMFANTISENDMSRFPNNSKVISNCTNDKSRSLFHDYDTNRKAPIHFLEKDTNKYFRYYGNMSFSCLIEGTNHVKTKNSPYFCRCKSGWFGPHCAYPEAFRHSQLPKFYPIYRRKEPRRIIYAFPFNVEFEITEARFASLGDLVDVFLVAESNYSAHGDAKPLRFLQSLKNGFCSDLHHKIAYVYIGHFPWLARKIGWIADDLPRDLLGTQGLRNQVKNVKHDDLFILTDADELPSREALLFLKLHTGYPEPFGFRMRWTTFGFQWIAGTGNQQILTGSTVGLLNHVFYGKASKIRNAAGHLHKAQTNVNTYIKSGGLVRMWKLGGEGFPCGWHCSWCFKPEFISIKLTSAHNGDFPRWGDYPEKRDHAYIRSLVKRGMWFDDKSTLTASDKKDAMYAPPFFKQNFQRFKYLLQNVY